MKHFRLFAILLLLVCKWTTVAHGQTQEPAINIEFTDIPLSEAISRIEKSSKYTFFYDAKQTDLTLRVSLHAKQLPISAALRQMLAPTGLDFTISERQIALIPAARKTPAGSRTITGTVNDSHELPLAGVAVTLEGDNTRGTVSGNNGSFTITVPDADAVLSFTYLGYISKKVSVPVSQNSLEVFLAEDAVRMEDVVVVGYGTQKKVNLTGAITTVDDTQLANRSAPSVAHMLQGAVPGLTISTSSGRPGNSADLNIRGITSINGGSPLVLIDGAEGDLMKLNPNDVASISVIKDASAAAIYGARAAYGVVLVTTKEGDDSDKTRVSYSGRWGWNSPTTSTDYETRGYYSVYVNDLFWHADAGTNYTNYTEQDMMELWARRNDKVENPERPWVKIDQRDGRDTYVYYANFDWYHYLFKDEHPSTSHSVSLSGGNSKVKYMLSGNYYSEEGLFRQDPDRLQRINFRSKISFDINKWLKISNNTSYYNYQYYYPGPSGVNTAFSLGTVHALASMMPYNPDGTSVYYTSLSKYSIMDGLPTIMNKGGQNEYALMGFFGRLNYDYKGKYLVEVSGRYDGTSRFKRGHRWGFFPSFSLGWRISEEPFFEGIREKFNNFKIRYSYGQLGNQNVGYYDYIRKISIGNQNYLFGGDKPTTATISAPVASNLSWETSIHNNLGVDMSFLNNRLAFSADFYIRDTKDMLTSGVALPSVYGADSPKMNSADLRTKGYELSLSWRDEFQLLRRPFTYSVTVTFNDYVTDITKYDNPDRTFAKSYYEGMRWGEIWGYRIGGLFATDAEAAGYAVDQTAVNNRINAAAGSERGLHAGDLKFLDLDGDNVISIGKNTVDDPGDREIIGNSQPRFHYGTTLSMSWAGIDFSIFFQGIGRRHWYPKANTIAFWGPYARPYASWIPKDFHEMYWSEENPDAYFPRPRGYVALSGTNRELTAVNDRYMQNIRYCRLKNLTIGYTLPKKWTRKVLIENLRVYFTGENLATWSPIHSDYIDPEMAAMNDEMRTYPWQKTYMFGVDVTF